MPDNVFEIRKQRAIEEAKKPELLPESEERDMTFLKLTLRRLMSYIYGAPNLDVSRSHTTTQHSR